MNMSERSAELGHNNMVLHPFTVRKVAEGHALYVAMCKGKVPQRSIRSKHGKGKGYYNPGIVMGQGTSYHGAISLD